MKFYFRTTLNYPFITTSISLIILALLTVNYTGCTRKIELKTDEEQERELIVNNKVKTKKAFKTEYRNGIAKSEFLLQVVTYNAEGFKTKEINYNDSARVHSVINYEYDSNRNLVSSISKGPDSSLIFREIRKYNDQNKRTELIFYLPDGTYKYRNIFTYDLAGKPDQLSYYWPEGLKSINKYSYKNGLKTSDKEYNPHGKINYEWILSYDEFGNQTEAIQYYPDSAINARIISAFNKNNQIQEQTTFFGKSFKSKFIFEYDNKNLLTTKTELSSPDRVSVIYRYQYEFR